MNRKIFQKLIDELQEEKPRLDYILGILETLIESLPEETPTAKIDKAIDRMIPAVIQDEGTLLDKEARARLANIKVTYDN